MIMRPFSILIATLSLVFLTSCVKNVILDAGDTDDKGYILCITPSRDYDRYLQEAYRYIDIQQSTWTRTYTYIDSGVPRKNFTPDEYSDPRNKENYYERTRNH